MELYLDFINIFIRLLSILGRNTRRDWCICVII
jgi:FtsH-binding integral membrane protein